MNIVYSNSPLLFLILFFLLSAGCHSKGQSPNEDRLPTRRELSNLLRQNRTLTLVYPSDKKYQDFYQNMVKELAKNSRFRFEVKGVEDKDLKRENIEKEILFIIGNVASSKTLTALKNKLPVKLEAHSFEFDNKTYRNSNAIFKLAIYPNPLNPTLPIYLLTGNDNRTIYQFLNQQYANNWLHLFRSWGYEIYQNKSLKVAGYFSESTWRLDKKIHFDFTEKNDTIFQSPHFQFITHNTSLSKEAIASIAKNCEAVYASIGDFVETNITFPKIDYHFYPSIESKGLQRDNMKIASCDIGKNCVEVVANNHFDGPAQHPENLLLLRKILGEPEVAALEVGLYSRFTYDWQKKGYQYWCEKLYQSNNLPPLQELLDNELFAKESRLVMGCMAGVFVDFLIKKYSKKTFLKNYKQWQAVELNTLSEEWTKYLSEVFVNPMKKIASNQKQLPYLKGFNFAHEGYRVYNGYGSQLAKASLTKLRQIGSNAIAIIPYSYMRDPKQAAFISIERNTGGENDESVLSAHYEAKKLGMMTMLKPQIWVGRSWPGEIEMPSEEAWNDFFDYYYRWIRHYAILAEIHGFDSFCLGVEFAKATLAREQDWRAIIRRIRGIYKGSLTYAANWGEEFENLKFWEELDFIGLNCYYPLSSKDQASKRELAKAFGGVMNKAAQICKKYDKPLVFTEIGFRSVDGTWKNPHEDSQNRPYNEAAQKLCYEVVLEGIQNKPWCKGILWWKWPSYLSYRGSENTGFSPNNKQGEIIVENFFKTKIK